MPDWLHFLGRLHPVVLHLPIGLLAGVVLVDLAGLLRRSDGLRRAGTVLLCATLAAAMVAVGSGLLLAEGDAKIGDTVDAHRWLGIAATIGLSLAISVRLLAGSRRSWAGYGLVLLTTVGLVTATGHLGGLMTHGSTFLSQHAPGWIPPVLLENPLAGDGRVAGPPVDGGGSIDADFDGVVAPALETHCVRCHGAGDASGGLRLDSPAGLMDVGVSGLPLIVPGDALASALVRRITLPHDDERFMPPDGGEPVDPPTILAIMRWIDRGARTIVEPPDPLDTPPPPADLDALVTLVAAGARVVPEAQGSTRLVVSLTEATLSAAMIDSLETVADRIVDLDARGVTEIARCMPAISRMVRLERASFAETGLGDEDLVALAGLTRLRRLNLRQTVVGDGGLDGLAAITSVREVVLTGTGVSDASLARLADRRPDLRVIGHEAIVPQEIDPEPAFTTPTSEDGPGV